MTEVSGLISARGLGKRKIREGVRDGSRPGAETAQERLGK